MPEKLEKHWNAQSAHEIPQLSQIPVWTKHAEQFILKMICTLVQSFIITYQLARLTLTMTKYLLLPTSQTETYHDKSFIITYQTDTDHHKSFIITN